MALVLSLRGGEEFYVGDERVVVTNVRRKADFDIATDHGLFTMNPETWIEFLPGAKATVSEHQPEDSRLVRLVLNAPGLKIGRVKPHNEGGETP